MRDRAVRGIERIESEYVVAIERLYEAVRPREALWLTCQALAVPPDMELPQWPATLELYRKLWTEQHKETAPSVAKGCVDKYVPDSWGKAHELRSPLR